jgi:aminoglycoside phosphotransferase (APT) family kinase protein
MLAISVAARVPPEAESPDVTTTDGRAGIDAALVARLVAEQFPQWAGLPVRPVPVEGWDNRTYRLGDELTVRLPSHQSYAAAVAKENRWLPVLAPQLPVPIPQVLGQGRPSADFHRPWSVRAWLPGRTASADTVPDKVAFARALAGFIQALQRIDPTGGPAAGAHSFYRGASLRHYDLETRQALGRWSDRVDAARAGRVWQAALDSAWDGPPSWFHGDVAIGNLLVEQGRLSAVIDFGTSGVGDPACDLVLAWTFLSGVSRRTFRTAVEQDADCWARARGWALWKALISLTGTEQDRDNLRIIADVLSD